MCLRQAAELALRRIPTARSRVFERQRIERFRVRFFELILSVLLGFVLVVPSTWAASARVRQMGMIDVPGFPGFEASVIADGHLILAHSGADTVDVFNLAKRRLVAQVKDMAGASGLAVDAAGGKLYVANRDANRIAIVSTKNWEVVGNIPLQAAAEKLLFVPEQNRLYTVNPQDQSVSAIDFNTRRVITEDAGGKPEQLVFDPIRKVLLVSLQDRHAIAAFDFELKLTQRFNLVASQPTGMALDAKSRRLYVAVRYAVVTLDAETGREIGRSAAPGGVGSLRLDAERGVLYAAAANAVAIYKTRSAGLLSQAEIRTEIRGSSLAYDPASRLIYLPGGREGRSKLLIFKQFDAPPANQAVATAGQVATR